MECVLVGIFASIFGKIICQWIDSWRRLVNVALRDYRTWHDLVGLIKLMMKLINSNKSGKAVLDFTYVDEILILIHRFNLIYLGVKPDFYIQCLFRFDFWRL